MIWSDLLNSNQHENNWYCESETSSEVYRWKIHSVLENESPHFSCYAKRTRIYELRVFGCDIYSITPKPDKLENITHEWSLMDQHQRNNGMVGSTYKETQVILIWKINEHNNQFGKDWSPGSNFLNGTDI